MDTRDLLVAGVQAGVPGYSVNLLFFTYWYFSSGHLRFSGRWCPNLNLAKISLSLSRALVYCESELCKKLEYELPMWGPIATTIRDSRHHHVPHLIQGLRVTIICIVHRLIIHLVVVNPPGDGGGVRDLVPQARAGGEALGYWVVLVLVVAARPDHARRLEGPEERVEKPGVHQGIDVCLPGFTLVTLNRATVRPVVDVLHLPTKIYKILGPFTPSVRSTLRQLCDDARDTVLIEDNGVTQKWVATPFWSKSNVFNENSTTSIIAELSQCLL